MTRSLPILLLAALAACRDTDPLTRDVRDEPPGVVERALTPSPVPLPAPAIAEAEQMVKNRVAREWFPSGAIAVGNRVLVQRVAAYGRLTWDEDAPAVSADSTLYDLASLTKVVATTAAVMALVEDGRLSLDDRVRRWVPQFSGGDKDSVTVRHLLTHTAGVRAGASDIASEVPGDVRRYLITRPLALKPGEDVLYSDIGFVILWIVAQRAAGEPLPQYLKRRVWGPLGMASTQVGVPTPCARCAPTLQLEDPVEPYTGGSYDEVARRMDGVAGNAGAFSTARDLSRFAAMIANEGRLGNVRVFQKRTVRDFTRPQPGAGTRALGWEVYCREGKVPDHAGCEQVYAFGHTGATGTSIWIDPVGRSWVVLLTNRTYLPKVEDVDMQAFRRRVYGVLVPSE
ncbi:MAG TPA: serine hydrolase domain-containing protein [Longimicrobium sp.]|jgi:CubicO group peptidase (beta-lactamase class C family)